MARKKRSYRKSVPTTNRFIDSIFDLIERCIVCPETGCYFWMGAEDGTSGYGRVLPSNEGKRVPEATHRYSFRRFKNPGRNTRIPKGYDVDHLCRHWYPARDPKLARKCCNPEHLEAVKPLVNQERRRLDYVWLRLKAEYGDELEWACEELDATISADPPSPRSPLMSPDDDRYVGA